MSAWLRERVIKWLRIDERISLTLIRWREKGNLLSHEQRDVLRRYEEGKDAQTASSPLLP